MSEQEAQLEAGKDQTQQFEDDSSPEDVAEAKTLGWKDPSEWKGTPPKNGFVKASEYVERGKTVVPIIRSENAKLKSELADARKELTTFKAETAKTVEGMSRMTKVALDRQRAQLEDKYSAAIDAATEVGDKEAVRKLRADERADLKKFDEAAADPEPKKDDKKDTKGKGFTEEVSQTLNGWIEANTWYSSDAEMQSLANIYSGKLEKDKPGLTLAENLEETRKYVAKRFPEKFGAKSDDDEGEEEAPARGSRVEGGSRMAGGGGGSKFSKLPADAKAQADKFIKEDGLFLEKGETVEKDLSKARERYAADYLGDSK